MLKLTWKKDTEKGEKMMTITKGLVLGINKKEIIKVGENITIEYSTDERGNKRVVICNS